MSFTLKYFRYLLPRSSVFLNRCDKNSLIIHCQTFKTNTKIQKSYSRWKILGLASLIGVGVGVAYSYSKTESTRYAILNPGSGEKTQILKELPKVDISRKVQYPADSSDLKIILFQYPTCPFCCKVRAFLDYFGLSYSVVEVNPVLRQQLKWSQYKKVPVLLVKVRDGYLQLNDSSAIISTLTSYFHDREIGLNEVADFYTTISYMDDDGAVKKEILNRYFLMYHGIIPKDSTKETIAEERKWRKWADDVLVHTLSPNVYRTKDEALQAFTWFSEVGHWKDLFPVWEQYLVVYVGAFAMWIIGKRLKKKYSLKDDVRQSLYDECNVWLRELKRKGTEFHGGIRPNLADLAVYGVLSSIEGCVAFSDLMENTNLGPWYSEMKRLISLQAGAPILFVS